MDLIRPNGMIERLGWARRSPLVLESYGRPQPGPSSPEAMRIAARQDRRQRQRRAADPLRGRLIDLTA